MEELRYTRNIEQRTTLVCDENDRLRERIIDLQEINEKLNARALQAEKLYADSIKLNEQTNFELRSLKVRKIEGFFKADKF